MIRKGAILTCLASTWYMTGLIWFVQTVRYPLFDRVRAAAFRDDHLFSDLGDSSVFRILNSRILNSRILNS